MSDARTEARQGAIFALAGYTFWGFAPAYFVLVGFAEPFEVLAQRIVWSLPLLLVLVTLTRQWRILARLTRREYLYLMGSAICLTINWLAFIWAIHEGNIVETSLGYFINPLVSVLLGWAVLHEEMRFWQWCATGIAALGIVVELIVEQLIPVYGLTLAFSFGCYGLLRKQVNLPPSVGLGVETAFVFPLALAYLIYTYHQGPQHGAGQLVLLGMGGLVTVLPLLCFAAAATRLPLTVLGNFQYLAPSLSLLLALFVYGEAVAPVRWMTLAAIWAGVVIFSLDALSARRGRAGSLASEAGAKGMGTPESRA